MPKNAKVFLRYGPYESCWTVDYRINRLQGLIQMLTKNGHKLELRQLPYINLVELWVKGERVFTCKITDLNFAILGRFFSVNGKNVCFLRRGDSPEISKYFPPSRILFTEVMGN